MAEATDTPVLDLLARMHADAIKVADLEPETLVLVRIAALVALDAPAVSYALNLAVADDLDIDPDQIRGVLSALAPIVGTVRIASALGNIADGLDIDMEIAEQLQAGAEEQA